MKIAVPDMISPSYFPALAAVELGFFQREGLDVTHDLRAPTWEHSAATCRWCAASASEQRRGWK
jgi:NitT/TauT family transport system substrate-binding protein